MKYLILGASGFIGTRLALALLKDESNYLKLYSRSASSQMLTSCARCSQIIGDFIREDSFDNLVEDVDYVYHLVSMTRPANTNLDIPREMTQLVEPTAKLLDACVLHKVKKVIFVSSGGTVYGKEQDPPFVENMQTCPINAYGAHKVTLELLFRLYGIQNKLNYCIVRLSNPYGPGQKPDGSLGVVTTFVNKAIHGEKASIYGDGSIIRDYIFIDDAINGLRSVEGYQGKHTVFNLGSGTPLSIMEIVDSIERTLNLTMNIEYLPSRKADIQTSYLDVGRYTSCFGYPATTSLADGIELTARFLRNQ